MAARRLTTSILYISKMAAPEAHPTTLFVRNLKPATTKADLDSHFGSVGPLRRTLIVTDHSTRLCKGFGFVHYALAEDAKSALSSLNGSVLHGRRISLHFALPRQRGKPDEDGGLAPRSQRPADKPGKKKGKLKGALAMRTVLLRRRNGGELSEDDARAALGEDWKPESVLLVADGKEARCTFDSWAQAGKAAAAAHGERFDACVEALKGGKSTRLIVRNLPFLVNADEFRDAFSKYASVREVRLEPPRALKGKLEGKAADVEKREGGLVQCAGFGFVEYFLVADAKFAMTKLNGAKIGGRVIAVDLALGKSDYVKKVDVLEEAEDAGQKDDIDGEIEEVDAREEEDGIEDDENSSESDSDSPEATMDESHKGKGKEDGYAASSKSKADKLAAPKKAPLSSESEMSRTVFVRNILFETSAPELWKAMAEAFGPVEQAVLVKDRVTGRPRGTAFVRFASEADAEKAVQQAGAGDTSKSPSALARPNSGGFALHGRHVMLSKAVDRSKAKDLAEGESEKATKDDPRNLRLAWIGQVKPGTREAQGLSEADIARRAKSDIEKKTKLSRNPNAFVSDVRLSVRNMPKEFEDQFLKQMFLIAASDGLYKGKGTKGESAEKKEAPNISMGQKDVGYRKHPRITYCKIIRDEERKDRSKGYGFVQFEKHEHALAALHCANNNPKVLDMLVKAAPKFLKIDEHRERLLRKQWGDARRLQVDFSVEDRRIVQVLEGIKEKGRKLSEAHKQKRAEEGPGGHKSARKILKKGKKGSSGKQQEKTSDPEQKVVPKSEKRSNLKRKRAEATERREAESKRRRSNGDDTVGGKGTKDGNRKGKTDAATEQRAGDDSAAARKRNWEEMKQAEKRDAKPKKPRRKRNAAEVKRDAKLDSLVDAYKRKLEKGANKTGPAPKASGSGMQAGSSARWFD